MKNKEDKYFSNLASQYAVCSELAKRKIKASLIYINNNVGHEVVLDEDKSTKLKIKTTSKHSVVTNFFQKYISPEVPHPDFWIFVFIDIDFTLRFFIMNHEELAEVQMKTNKVVHWGENKNGVDNISLDAILEFENKWGEINQTLN